MSPIDDLVDYWEEQREQGVCLSPEELCAQHPELVEEIRWQLQALQAIDSNFAFPDQNRQNNDTSAAANYEPSAEIEALGRFRLERCYAIGGLGQIFTAHDEILDRKVAIKFPKRQGMTAEQISRFEQEARITGQLEHPGIVPIHSLDVSRNGEPCYVMRFVQGETLQQKVEKTLSCHDGKVDREYFRSDDLRHHLQAFVALCNIVAYAHGQDIVHRDIKPNNVLIGPFGETLLLDWGIAKRMSEQTLANSPEANAAIQRQALRDSSPVCTLQGQMLGTPAYASPEQSLGESSQIGFTSDIYSLGATLFSILSGKSPLEAAGWSKYMELMHSSEAKLVNYLPQATPPGLRAICSRCLQVDPSQRYPTVVALAADVDRYLAREPLSVLPEGWWTHLGRATRQRPTATGALVASALVVFIAAITIATIVHQNNLQLSKGVQQLRVALDGAQRANDIALSSLRGMVDEVVTLKFAQGEQLSQKERNYIQSILQQYLKLSELQNETERARAVQAEAFLQIGMMYYHLDQYQEALPTLQTAVQLLTILNSQAHASAYLPDLSTALVNVATIQIETGDPNACLATTAKALQAIAQFDHDLPPETAYLLVGDRASLHRLRAESFEVNDDSSQCIIELEAAIKLLEHMMSERSNDISVQFAMGQVCRMMGSAQLEIAGQSLARLKTAKGFGDRSVNLLVQLSSQHRNVPRFQMALVWAHYDRGCVLAAMEDSTAAIADFAEAHAKAVGLSTRFPLISSYRDCQPGMLVRRAAVYSQIGNWSAAALDLSAAATDLTELAAQRTSNESLYEQLVQTQLELARVELRLLRPAQAAKSIVEARSALNSLASLNTQKADALSSELEQMTEELNDAL